MDSRELDALRLLSHTLLDSGRHAAARDVLLGLAAARPDDQAARRNLVLAYLRLGDYAAAEPLARSLAGGASGRELAPSLFFLAHSLWGLGRMDECRKVVDRYAEAIKFEGAAERKLKA